ncbi:hypothetical protein VTI74DRAFT_704 [Chaetomium olivicolor]
MAQEQLQEEGMDWAAKGQSMQRMDAWAVATACSVFEVGFPDDNTRNLSRYLWQTAAKPCKMMLCDSVQGDGAGLFLKGGAEQLRAARCPRNNHEGASTNAKIPISRPVLAELRLPTETRPVLPALPDYAMFPADHAAAEGISQVPSWSPCKFRPLQLVRVPLADVMDAQHRAGEDPDDEKYATASIEMARNVDGSRMGFRKKNSIFEGRFWRCRASMLPHLSEICTHYLRCSPLRTLH